MLDDNKHVKKPRKFFNEDSFRGTGEQKKRSSVIRVIKSESLQLSSFSPNKEKVRIDFAVAASVVVVVVI